MSGRNSSEKEPRQEGMSKVVMFGQGNMRREDGKRNWRDKQRPDYVGFGGHNKTLEIYLKIRQKA